MQGLFAKWEKTPVQVQQDVEICQEKHNMMVKGHFSY